MGHKSAAAYGAVTEAVIETGPNQYRLLSTINTLADNHCEVSAEVDCLVFDFSLTIPDSNQSQS